MELNRPCLVVGIDPGNTGAIAFLGKDGSVKCVNDMPSIKVSKTGACRPDHHALIEMFREIKELETIDCVYIEEPQKVPSMMGSNSQANYLAGYYKCLFILIFHSLSIKHEWIQPKEWQKYWKIKKSKRADTKMLSERAVSAMFPNIDVRGPRGGLKDGRCDALLIAEFGRRRYYGSITQT